MATSGISNVSLLMRCSKRQMIAVSDLKETWCGLRRPVGNTACTAQAFRIIDVSTVRKIYSSHTETTRKVDYA
jgi:hypothetical protein